MYDALDYFHTAVVRRLRSREMTQAELADRLGFSASYMYKQLRGKRRMRMPVVRELDRVLDAGGELIRLAEECRVVSVSLADHPVTALGGYDAVLVPDSATLFERYRGLSVEDKRALFCLTVAPARTWSMAAMSAIADLDQPSIAQTVTRLCEAGLFRYVNERGFVPACVRPLVLDAHGDAASPRRSEVVVRAIGWAMGSAATAANALLPNSVDPSLVRGCVGPWTWRPTVEGEVEETGVAGQAIRWFTDEFRTLRETINTIRGCGQERFAWRLILACWPFLWFTQDWSLALELAQTGLLCAHIEGDHRGVGLCLKLLGWAKTRQGLPEGVQHLQNAARILRGLGDDQRRQWAVFDSAMAYA